jgi:hypothetical protein
MTSVVPNLTPPKKCHPERSASGAPIARQCDGGKRSEGSASASQEASIRTKMGAPSIRVLCEWAGKHDTPARTGGSRGLQASEKSAATPRPSGPDPIPIRTKRVPRPFAFFANGRESTTLRPAPEGAEAFRPRKSQHKPRPSGPVPNPIRTKNGCPVHSRSLRMGGKARHSSAYRREPRPSGLGKVSSNAKAFRPGLNHPHLLCNRA